MNKCRGIGHRGGGWSRAQWNNLGGGSTNWGTVKPQRRKNSRGGNTYKKTIRPQRRGLGRERIAYNSRTRIGGDYFNNIKRGIQDTTLRNKTTNWVSGKGGRNCRTRGGYITIICSTK